VKTWLVRARRFWLDALIILLAGIGVWSVTVGQGRPDGPQGPLWFDILAVLAALGALLLRRRFPFGAPVAVGVVVGASTLVDPRLAPFAFVLFIGGCIAVMLIGLLPERPQALAGIAVGVGVEALVTYRDPRGNPGAFVAASLIFAILWTIAFALGRSFREADLARERAAQAERGREARAAAAVAEERARIARELHDVVGHSVSVMTVQASAVRRLLRPDQEREREALLVVERSGREALAEMRRMVGVLRRPEEAPARAPQPTLAAVEKLAQQTRDAGLPVELRVEGEPVQLAAGLDLTAYRLVQEGLTNALKHAQAKRAEVVVRYGPTHLEVSVCDDGRGPEQAGTGGHGLLGMRERVAVYGGELSAGPRPEGGYRLLARLPLAL
jgi:signal transduction histidine kinase